MVTAVEALVVAVGGVNSVQKLTGRRCVIPVRFREGAIAGCDATFAREERLDRRKLHRRHPH